MWSHISKWTDLDFEEKGSKVMFMATCFHRVCEALISAPMSHCHCFLMVVTKMNEQGGGCDKVMVEGARYHHQMYASLAEEKRSKVVVEGVRCRL